MISVHMLKERDCSGIFFYACAEMLGRQNFYEFISILAQMSSPMEGLPPPSASEMNPSLNSTPTDVVEIPGGTQLPMSVADAVADLTLGGEDEKAEALVGVDQSQEHIQAEVLKQSMAGRPANGAKKGARADLALATTSYFVEKCKQGMDSMSIMRETTRLVYEQSVQALFVEVHQKRRCVPFRCVSGADPVRV